MIENAAKISDVRIEEYAIRTLLIFNKFMRSDLHSFSSERPSLNKDFENAKETIDLMKKMPEKDSGFYPFLEMQKSIYALLLKTAILSFQKNLGVRHSLSVLMDFINMDLGLCLERETVLCCLFLRDRNNSKVSKFFRGIQRNSKKIVNTIRGMAWDLFHLRFCIEFGMANDINQGSICLHYFITRDNGLADLADAYPLKLLIYKKGGILPKVVFDKSILEIEIPEIDILMNLFDNQKIRSATCQNRDVDKLIEILENELLNTCTTL